MKNNTKRFNILDLVIILLVVAILLGAFFRTTIIRFISGEESRDMVIEFETEPLSALYYGYFVEGDRVYIADTDISLGTLSGISKTLAPVMVQMEDGSYTTAVELERNVVSGTLTVKGFYRDGVYSLSDGTVISAGNTVQAESSLIAFDLTVKSVSFVPETEENTAKDEKDASDS